MLASFRKKMERHNVIENLAKIINNIQLSHPVRIGIDGVDASGKTKLANELVDPNSGRFVYTTQCI